MIDALCCGGFAGVLQSRHKQYILGERSTGLAVSGGRATTFMSNVCARKIPSGSVVARLVLQPSTAAGSVVVIFK